MKILTVIVPCYNVSKYVDECLNSLLAMDVLSDLEVIAINDGSTDDTLDKIRKFEKNYPDTFTVVDKPNGGHGSGINVGIELSKGKFLKVLDSDDWFKTDALSRLIAFLRNCEDDIDVVVNTYSQIWEHSEKREVHSLTLLNSNTPIKFQDFNKNRYRFTIHSLTINSKIYKERVTLKIDEKTAYDDVEYVLYPIPFVKSLVYIDDDLYQYRMGSAGQSVNILNMQKNRNKLLNIIINSFDYYKKNENIMTIEQREYYLRDLGCTVGDYCNILFSLENISEAKIEFMSFIKSTSFPVKYINNKKAKIVDATCGISFYALARWYQHRLQNM